MANFKGPIFDGSAGAVIDQAVHEIEQRVGEVAEQDLASRFKAVLQRPTGRYVSRLRVATQQGLTRVDDQRAVQGPWLEGTSRQNARTRFRGYGTFRRVAQELDKKATKIAEAVIARYTGRLG